MTDNNEIVFAIDLLSSPRDRLSLIEEHSNTDDQNFQETINIEDNNHEDNQEEFEYFLED